MADRDELESPSRTGATTGTSGLSDWATEDAYWRESYASRPYVRGERGYEYYRPGYRYGFESANRFRGREWNEIESELRAGWNRYEHRAQSAWENVKDAVRDAWDRVRGKDRGTAARR
jgi:hypothetical protein